MIVSASYRTDIPAFFADWFRACLAAGAVDVANPYGGKPTRITLRGDGVDGYVFWTRNVAPFAAALDDVAALALPFVVQYTVTGYPRAIDAHTPRAAEAVARISALAARFGPRAVVWRYDPVLMTSLTPTDWHRGNFTDLARQLAGSVDECVVSTAHIYKKTKRRLKLAAKEHEFTWNAPNLGEKRALLSELAEIAAENGIKLTICSQPDVLSDHLLAASCIDAARLSDIAGYDISARQKGNRDGCLCAESRDIGAYDTCAHGCVYCYAVSDHDRAVEKMRGLNST
jgi:DNA repair photolyase